MSLRRLQIHVDASRGAALREPFETLQREGAQRTSRLALPTWAVVLAWLLIFEVR